MPGENRVERRCCQNVVACDLPDDEWTVFTEDGSLSAQWEHTLLITETGVEILSK